MKVFISFGGDNSEKIAKFLYDNLKLWVQGTQPWIASEDLRAGQDYFTLLTKELSTADVGVFCLTKSNLNNRWMHFEAGALHLYLSGSNSDVKKRDIFVYLIGVDRDDVKSPLNRFQSRISNFEGTLKLVEDIYKAKNPKTEHDSLVVRNSLEGSWPDFNSIIEKVILLESSELSNADNHSVQPRRDVSNVNGKSTNQGVSFAHSDIKIMLEIYINRDKYTNATSYAELRNSLKFSIKEIDLKISLSRLVAEGLLKSANDDYICAYEITESGEKALTDFLK